MLDTTGLSIGSYNCRGFSVYIKSLQSKLCILFLQEHWLSDSQLALFDTLNSDFLFTGVSGFANTNLEIHGVNPAFGNTV